MGSCVRLEIKFAVDLLTASTKGVGVGEEIACDHALSLYLCNPSRAKEAKKINK